MWHGAARALQPVSATVVVLLGAGAIVFVNGATRAGRHLQAARG